MPINPRVMNAELIERIETFVERAASALLGGAVGFAVYSLLGVRISLSQLVACAAGSGALAYLASSFAFRSVLPHGDGFRVSTFLPCEFNFLEADVLDLTDSDRLEVEELVLTDSDMLGAASQMPEKQPLVLDDILAEIDPEARVVRLFDRKAMPTPGQLKSRIDDHLGKDTRMTVPDASAALSEALAELRRSLR